MIRCGLSILQSVSLTGSDFSLTPVVLVTTPDGAAPVPVTPDSASATQITFRFVFAACGTYTFVVADATGECDTCASDPFTLTLTPQTCPREGTVVTLGELTDDTMHRLGDDGAVWARDEVSSYLIDAYKLIGIGQAVFWDMLYSENLPRGFSVNQPWELEMLGHGAANFNYGVANFTAEFERHAGKSLGWDPRLRIGPANHTSPFEATDGLLVRAGASLDIPATVDLPKTLTRLDRALWDTREIDALEPRSHSRMDGRYEITKGEVYGYMWQKDGVRTFRKVRVPAAQGDTLVINGSWGILRDVADLTDETVTGPWGIPRRIAGFHPMGPEVFGLPRRPFLDGKNVRIEHFRQGRELTADNIILELPKRYTRYLMDYAQATCLSRPGPGYDEPLSKYFDARWKRGLARIARRLVLVDHEHVMVFGGDGEPSVMRPPRPSLPWQYGSRVR